MKGAARLALIALTAHGGCATAQEIAALRQVSFRFDGISSPRVAGVPLDRIVDYDDLPTADIARLTLAISSKDVLIDLTVHVEGENPRENDVTARLVALDWGYLVDNREIVTGQLRQAYTFPPGEPTDVPLQVSFNLVRFFGGDAQDLFEIAMALAGRGTSDHKVTLRLEPTVDTPVGPIRYPFPIELDLSRKPGG